MCRKILVLVLLISSKVFGFQVFSPFPPDGNPTISIITGGGSGNGSDVSTIGDDTVDNGGDDDNGGNDDDGDFGHPPDDPDSNSSDPDCDKDNDSSSGAVGDQDNDVPTLLSIRSRIHSLQQELTLQAERTRGTTTVSNGESSNSQQIALADIYDALNHTKEKQEIKTKETEKQTKEDEAKDKITDFFDNAKEDAENFAESFSVADHTDSTMDTLFEVDIGSYSFYLDPLKDTFSGAVSIGYSWSQIADWISLIIGITCVIIYYRNLKELVFHFLETILIAPKSGAVTNIAVFGNSIGTLGLMILKIGFIGILVGTTITSAFAVMYESNFTLGGTSQGVMSILSSITSILTSGGGWMSHAFSLFCDLVPVVSISAMVAFYYLQRFGILIFVGAQLVISQTLT